METTQINRKEAINLAKKFGTGNEFKNKLSGTIKKEIFNPELKEFQLIFIPEKGKAWIKNGSDFN